MGINRIAPYSEWMYYGRAAAAESGTAPEDVVPETVTEKKVPGKVSGAAPEQAVPETASREPAAEKAAPGAASRGQDNQKAVSGRPPLEDIPLTLRGQESFQARDMEKAVDDMKRDSVLQQYQYFVGSSERLYLECPDGKVIRKL